MCFRAGESSPPPLFDAQLVNNDMNYLPNNSQSPMKNITWKGRPRPAQCEHEFEVLPLGDGVIRRCAKCGRLEAK